MRPLPGTTKPEGELTLLYARPLSEIDHTLARVRLFLGLGVLGGAVLALLAGLFVARSGPPTVRGRCG